MFDFIVRIIMTTIVYSMSNYYTYHNSLKQECKEPLYDILHNILPDLSKYVYIRDIVLPLFFIPLLFIKSTNHKLEFIYYFIQGFMILITLKAITIFFTYQPSSNPDCNEKKYLNHCFHQMFSGHNSLVLLLWILYIKFNVINATIITILPVLLYSILILMTRAHYSVDIIVSYIITFLLINKSL